MDAVRSKPRANILGVGISAVNFQMAIDLIKTWVETGHRAYVCVCGVHGVMESQQDERVRQAINHASLATPDGMPMVWINHLVGYRHVTRVYGPDLMRAVCGLSQVEGYSHFLYGSSPTTLQILREQLKIHFPGLIIAGEYSPPFRELSASEEQDIYQIINQAGADIIWVGLSTPKQELWMSKTIPHLKKGVLIGVGAAFDFLAGTKKQAPIWMQKNGLEWCFRLMTEPRRLWRRYLINNPLFIWSILLQFTRIRRYPLDEEV